MSQRDKCPLGLNGMRYSYTIAGMTIQIISFVVFFCSAISICNYIESVSSAKINAKTKI